MNTVKLKNEKGERIYPFTVAEAVVGLNAKIKSATSGTNATTEHYEKVLLGVLAQGTYKDSKFTSGGTTSVAMKSFFLLPYLGVTFNFKLPSDIVVDIYYGNYHGASWTTCYFGEHSVTGITSGGTFTFPYDITYTNEYGDDTDGDNAYYYGLVFKKSDNSALATSDVKSYVSSGDIEITYYNPYGNIMERNTPAMDNIAGARMYFSLGKPKRLNDVYIHISDFHGNARGLTDCIELAEALKAKAILYTGDVVPQSAVDNFDWVAYYAEKTTIPILICPGNHDGVGMAATTFNKSFFTASPYSNNTSTLGYHYYDIPDGNIRVIELDCSDTTANYRMNSIGSTQITWLETTLTDAKDKGLGVIIISHQPIGTMEANADHPKFCVDGNNGSSFTGSDDVKSKVDAFITSGGEFIMYCNGHGHCDHAGWLPNTTNKQLHFNVASSTFATSTLNNDSPRELGRGRAGDLLNVYAIDRTAKTVTVVRFGNQVTANGVTRDKDTFSYV